MKFNSLLSLSLFTLTAGLSSCSSVPHMKPIDNALLAEAPKSVREVVVDARADRDKAEDAYALARRSTEEAEEQVNVARASLRTVRSQLDEAKLAVDVSEGGTTGDHEVAQENYDHALARADFGRESLALAKRSYELAKLREKLALEIHRLRIAEVELHKAEALQDVDLVEAQRIPVKDYRKQVTYHREEVETARARVRTAEARMDEAKDNLEDRRRELQSMKGAN